MDDQDVLQQHIYRNDFGQQANIGVGHTEYDTTHRFSAQGSLLFVLLIIAFFIAIYVFLTDIGD